MSKILMIVEGARTDVQLMKRILNIYGIDQTHSVVSYNANIYSLYNQMFKDVDPDTMDLKQVLKEHEKRDEIKTLFDDNYSDILLIFDLDPQDPQFSPKKIEEMLEYFNESSDNGKLYINYPMVESFYHMKSIPDEEYIHYVATMDELRSRKYKARVHEETYRGNYSKFAITKSDYDTVIKQNYDKAIMIVNGDSEAPSYKVKYFEEGLKLFEKQKCMIETEKQVAVLCTCVFYIIDFNPNLIV